MLTVDAGGTELVSLGGGTLLFVLVLIGAGIGWWRGVRAFLTITLASVVAYLLFVDGGDQFLGVINNIYSNLPRLFAILSGGDPAAVAPYGPLITGDLQIPLFVRVILFLVVIGVASRFNRQSWYSTKTNEPFVREMGAFTGALTALLWVMAILIFWQEQGSNLGGIFSPLNSVLAILPNVSDLVLPLILGFIAFIVLSLVLRFPLLLRA
jgi:membrane-associated protease RseP (regulator of RpoE activity)